MNDADKRVLSLFVTAGVILAFLLVDYVTPQVMQGPERWPLVGIALGACIAQVTLISAWAVFAPGNIVVRLPWALLLGLMMWYILAYSEGQASRFNYQADTTTLGISLLLGIVALQLPLWIAKRAFGYRMLAPGEAIQPTTSERFQFQIKHMLIGTLIFAVALSPLRFIVPPGGFAPIMAMRPLTELFVLVGVAIGANLVATLPCLWGGFVSTYRVVPLAIGWLLYCLLVSGVEFGVLCAALGTPPELDRAFGMVYLVNASQGILVFTVMRCYRALGYRLRRASSELPPPLSDWPLPEYFQKAHATASIKPGNAAGQADDGGTEP